MTTRKRKSKPDYSPLIEWPTEQLQLMPVVVERQTPIGARVPRPAETDLPVARSLSHRGRTALH